MAESLPPSLIYVQQIDLLRTVTCVHVSISSPARILRRRGGRGLVHRGRRPPACQPAGAFAPDPDARAAAARAAARAPAPRRAPDPRWPHPPTPPPAPPDAPR